MLTFVAQNFRLLARLLLLAELFLIPLSDSFTENSIFGTPQAKAEYRRQFGRQPGRGVNQGIRRRQFIRQDDIKEIPGFSNLVQVGNAILEKNRFGQFRKLFISRRSGRLIGATENETIRQLKEFYLTNFDKFRDKNGALVRQFLVNNGSRDALNGNLRVDLSGGVLPEFERMKGRDTEVKVAALNFLLNTISQSSRLLRVQPANVRADGTVALNLQSVMRTSALSLLVNDNPYDCGRGNTPPRLDWLIQRAMDPDIYYQLLDIPRDLGELTDRLGVQDRKQNTLNNKITLTGPPDKDEIGQNESKVSRDTKRTLEFQSMRNIPGGTFYISWDAKANTGSRIQRESRNPFIKGINFTHDASESIFHKPNGFLAFSLNAADGTRANEAPASIALAQAKPSNLDTTVDNPVACMSCHANGFIGGGNARGGDAESPYTDNFNRFVSLSRRTGVNHAKFFTTNARYRARADRDSRIFVNAIKRSGSFIPSDTDASKAADLIPQFVSSYRKSLTLDEAAKELKVPKAALASVLGRNDGFISRTDFEASFCGLQSRLSSVVSQGSVLDNTSGNSSVSGQNHNNGQNSQNASQRRRAQ